MFSDKSPFGYVDENGEYQGYDVYLAEKLGEDLGVEINYVSTEAASRIEYLETGKVDIILANFAYPYMNVALGVVSHDDNVLTSLDDVTADDQIIVISGTTAETYLTKEYPDIKLQKFDTYAAAKSAFENGTGIAWANDNTEVIAFATENEGRAREARVGALLPRGLRSDPYRYLRRRLRGHAGCGTGGSGIKADGHEKRISENSQQQIL